VVRRKGIKEGGEGNKPLKAQPPSRHVHVWHQWKEYGREPLMLFRKAIPEYRMTLHATLM
jgi:hypothetical protein